MTADLQAACWEACPQAMLPPSARCPDFPALHTSCWTTLTGANVCSHQGAEGNWGRKHAGKWVLGPTSSTSRIEREMMQRQQSHACALGGGAPTCCCQRPYGHPGLLANPPPPARAPLLLGSCAGCWDALVTTTGTSEPTSALTSAFPLTKPLRSHHFEQENSRSLSVLMGIWTSTEFLNELIHSLKTLSKV